MPRTAPRSRPKIGLLMIPPSYSSTEFRIPLGSSKKNQRRAHDEIGKDEEDGGSVAREKTRRALERSLAVGKHAFVVDETRRIRGQLFGGGVPLERRDGHGFFDHSLDGARN